MQRRRRVGVFGEGSSIVSSLVGLQKQSAYAPVEQQSSACPSPTPSSASDVSAEKSANMMEDWKPVLYNPRMIQWLQER
eukprot:5240670-Ditylum_brightwellii.AAC.1